MRLFESFHVALRALAANKLRSILTMLGIIIGVGAVIGLLSVGHGFEQFITNNSRGWAPISCSSRQASSTVLAHRVGCRAGANASSP